jgi:hypothetical protein
MDLVSGFSLFCFICDGKRFVNVFTQNNHKEQSNDISNDLIIKSLILVFQLAV